MGADTAGQESSICLTELLQDAENALSACCPPSRLSWLPWAASSVLATLSLSRSAILLS